VINDAWHWDVYLRVSYSYSSGYINIEMADELGLAKWMMQIFRASDLMALMYVWCRYEMVVFSLRVWPCCR